MPDAEPAPGKQSGVSTTDRSLHHPGCVMDVGESNTVFLPIKLTKIVMLHLHLPVYRVM